MNRFNLEACEFVIKELLKHDIQKVKDSQNLYFKDIIKLSSYGEFISSFREIFGYKCKLWRDPKKPEILMEILVITEIPKSLAKIRNYEEKMRNAVEKKFKKEDTVKFTTDGLIKAWELKTQKQDFYKKSKLMKALQPVDFNTDESMVDIDYNEIKSCKSSSSSEEEIDLDNENFQLLDTQNLQKMVKKRKKQKKPKKQKAAEGFEALKKMEKNINYILISSNVINPALEYYNSIKAKNSKNLSPTQAKNELSFVMEKKDNKMYSIQEAESIIKEA